MNRCRSSSCEDGAAVDFRVDRFDSGHHLAAHRHAEAYAALVIEGEYQEASLDGRYACRAGNLVIHPPFHEHANDFGHRACAVINLPLPAPAADLSGYRIASEVDGRELLTLARRDIRAAGLAALEAAGTSDPIAPPVWLGRFLPLLLADRPVGEAARSCGISVEHAGRTTRKWFGVGPVRLRQEGRIRRAIDALREGASPVEAAAAAGFADQPHLTRTLKAALGQTPARLRKAMRS